MNERWSGEPDSGPRKAPYPKDTEHRLLDMDQRLKQACGFVLHLFFALQRFLSGRRVRDSKTLTRNDRAGLRVTLPAGRRMTSSSPHPHGGWEQECEALRSQIGQREKAPKCRCHAHD